MPKNTPMGLIIGAFSFLFGFGIIWHMWWLVAVGVLGVVITSIVRSFTLDTDYHIPAAEVAKLEAQASR